MAFVTDLIWRSPLGLRINAQATADVLMTEDWVKVRGDQLAPRDGAYDLRITAELWETHFFDLVSLLAVDHPAGTEVFVDERFAVPPPALHVDRRPARCSRSPRSRDDRGQRRHRAGRARRTIAIVDFAGRGAVSGHHARRTSSSWSCRTTAPRSGPLWLVAQGWVHPTDSSINVAIGQGAHARAAGPRRSRSRTPTGRFRAVRAGLGFPAGKDKTILSISPGCFRATGPRRLRLATNLEIFWDRLGWAVGRPDVTRRAAPPADLLSADLRYRGYSVDRASRRRARPSGRATRSPAPRRAGATSRAITRASATCASCCAGVDDRYVIMNAGDELRLRFREAPPPGAGLVRDFVLVGDGWVKDGDFNTDVLAHRAAAADARAPAATTTPPRTARGRSGLPPASATTSRVPHAVRHAGPAARRASRAGRAPSRHRP